MTALDDDEITPVDRPVWTMHPAATKARSSSKPGVETEVDVPENGQNVRTLEQILATVEKVLVESRDIRESSQQACSLALQAFENMPKLEDRVKRVEKGYRSVVTFGVIFTALNFAFNSITVITMFTLHGR